jgi:hypothetical protein
MSDNRPWSTSGEDDEDEVIAFGHLVLSLNDLMYT